MNSPRRPRLASAGIELLPYVIFAAISLWLMFHTFGYDDKVGAMLVAPKVWSDFGAHIPLIRSFSLGNNWPPQYPLFPGEPIRYHFLFYFLVGMLEKAGFRIDWALNIPSALGLFLLLSGVWLVAKKLFSDTLTAALSVLFFLFNGSLGFVQFFQKHTLNFYTVGDIIKNSAFPAFAPWSQGDVTAFWNLNIYTNQRHLALAFAAVLLYLLTLLRLKQQRIARQIIPAFIWGLVIGVFPYFHQPSLIVFALMMTAYFLMFPRLRAALVVTGLTAGLVILPQVLPLFGSEKQFAYYPGYLIHDQLSLTRFVIYWWNNLGLHVILIPIGFLLSSKTAKKALIPFAGLFLVGNLFRFTIEIAANHKFFNMFLIVGAMFSAYAISFMVKRIGRVRYGILRIPAYGVPLILTFFLTFSGVIDLFPVINDTRGILMDLPSNPAAAWIAFDTPPDSVFLTASFLYHPASLAGRKIFLGWPYFAWSAGYDTTTRLDVDEKAMYNPVSLPELCAAFKRFHISYVTFERDHITDIPFDETLYRLYFPVAFYTPVQGITIYSTGGPCR